MLSSLIMQVENPQAQTLSARAASLHESGGLKRYGTSDGSPTSPKGFRWQVFTLRSKDRDTLIGKLRWRAASFMTSRLMSKKWEALQRYQSCTNVAFKE